MPRRLSKRTISRSPQRAASLRWCPRSDGYSPPTPSRRDSRMAIERCRKCITYMRGTEGLYYIVIHHKRIKAYYIVARGVKTCTLCREDKQRHSDQAPQTKYVTNGIQRTGYGPSEYNVISTTVGHPCRICVTFRSAHARKVGRTSKSRA